MILRTKQVEDGGQVKNHWPNLTYYPSISLGRLRKTTIKFSQDSWSAEFPENKGGLPTSWPQQSTSFHLTPHSPAISIFHTICCSYHQSLIPSVTHTICHSYHQSLILSVTHTICHTYHPSLIPLLLWPAAALQISPLANGHAHDSAESAIQSSCALPLPSLAPTISPGSDTWSVPMPAPPPADSVSHHISSLYGAATLGSFSAPLPEILQ